MSNVWAVFYPAHRSFGDVAVASARCEDPLEWERARDAALRNARKCRAEAERWTGIAIELDAHT